MGLDVFISADFQAPGDFAAMLNSLDGAINQLVGYR